MGKRSTIKPGKSILLKDVPVDVQQVLQDKIKMESDLCRCIRPMDYALYKIIREYQQMISGGQFVLAYHGHVVNSCQFNHQFIGDQIKITITIPITSSVGAHLNYQRIEK